MELTIEEVGKAFHELKDAVEKGTLTVEKKAAIDKVLDKYEETNQQLVRSTEIIKSHELEIKSLKTELENKGVEAGKIREQVEALEISLARVRTSGGNPDYRNTPEYKALDGYVRNGGDINMLSVETKAALRTDSATEGGVLVVPEVENFILKKITEIDGIRSIARVRPTSTKSLVIPTRTSIPVAVYEGEMETSPESVSAYGSETITAFRLTHTVPITRDMLMDAAFDMEREILTDAAEAFAYGEGNNFVAGTGFKAPMGFLNDTRITGSFVASAGASGVMSADDPIKLQGQLKIGYNGVFTLNRTTLADLRTKKSTDGVYLFAPGLNGPNPATIAGSPYVLCPSMPNVATNAYPLAFGEFRLGYTIVDRTAVEIIRDDFTRKKVGVVEFTVHRWNNGKVVLPEAIKVLKIG